MDAARLKRNLRRPVSLRTADYDYTLPEGLIARHPTERRDGARMMVLHRTEQRIEHRMFADFATFLKSGDLVVLNDTRVIPARAFSDDGRIELLFLEQVARSDADTPARGAAQNSGLQAASLSTLNPQLSTTWKCLVKPGRKMRLGALVHVGGVAGVVRGIEPQGERIIEFLDAVDLDTHGEIPLPPYFERKPEPDDNVRYQTVFAREAGAVAAPTAGLHFTPELLASVPHAFVTLHVGVGTFRSVLVDDLAEHRMHSERFSMSEATAVACNAAQRIVAVGTTSARVLETIGRPLRAMSGSTDIFIHPPYEPKVVGALLTNFHLPLSTLLMLVSAFAGCEFVLHAYAEAIRERYRFFSYGDCMLIV
ncbi:MAG: tRNA preQ1(34) S-adenosylmethionine ribosyltransferase-isomerase QueA [Chthoniobacteraceae bacterium]